ncbi:Protein of unknown function DUF1819 putative inner membrane [Thermoanaerobacterium thermosaccharolyticum DSM 571]|jgi:hypothetical protein|uniref:Inner membrane protein n=1 Tax=Thermoanaerobacterium thermosaccharolyticum (strain ATCC 7956 / DSM 571 / NCIMB 9385 / NCA 3814 / NCTC 13789 / WDCM 00135 / 2032) TaxID=580327 RepID=D9TSG7_THETC|nr:DUF1819 family protein [Thermoanaerobacterium thermosaccharolyticum]ADL68065.1 Protein of unknown function DUF1819 putative inner membrane [Thermoanaerobacterium thermosaccharolyticum DSM 571]TCW35718.1 putative inner membrane protein DUF1819 [Thermohydrogenium kirishiense]
MADELEYKSTIKSRPFLFRETKKAAELINKGLKEFEIKNKAKNDNIFQVNTETRRSEIASTVMRRLKALDDFLIDKLANGEIDTSKQIVVYAIMKTDRLFFEFMYEVFREKILLRDFTLQDKDFNIFFDRKKEQSERVASWDDYTFYKLKQVYIRILFEAGFIKNQKNDREITRPIVEEDVAYHLKEIGDTKYLNALTGEM